MKKHTYIFYSYSGKRYSFSVDLSVDFPQFDHSPDNKIKEFNVFEIIDLNYWLAETLIEIQSYLTPAQKKKLMDYYNSGFDDKII